MLTKRQHTTKRSFDLLFAIIGSFFLIIPIGILILLSAISSKKNGIFKQQRIGQYGKPFIIYKLRSMVDDDTKNTITIHRDKRITKYGHFIRKYHLDELPQIINVLIGNMSFVGPRPDVSGYADFLEGDDRIILSVKPGITGPATLKFKDEDKILLKKDNPKVYNDEVLWKQKVEINKEYLENWSLLEDLKYIIKTLF